MFLGAEELPEFCDIRSCDSVEPLLVNSPVLFPEHRQLLLHCCTWLHKQEHRCPSPQSGDVPAGTPHLLQGILLGQLRLDINVHTVTDLESQELPDFGVDSDIPRGGENPCVYEI